MAWMVMTPELGGKVPNQVFMMYTGGLRQRCMVLISAGSFLCVLWNDNCHSSWKKTWDGLESDPGSSFLDPQIHQEAFPWLRSETPL
ncbi:hypothetical protein TNCT_380601 [Trichonephila clavata]|uniref:Uncharacterized protein n=1 Tax=Trichonephila clavata TaxID=2740835 RepID=A0A8X6K9L0_TRICU|nr:hypothetical protein TNCT_380601 [Trichonephila clavata]